MSSNKPRDLDEALRLALVEIAEAKSYTPEECDAGGGARLCLEEVELLLLAAINFAARDRDPAAAWEKPPAQPQLHHLERIATALESCAGSLASIAGDGVPQR